MLRGSLTIYLSQTQTVAQDSLTFISHVQDGGTLSTEPVSIQPFIRVFLVFKHTSYVEKALVYTSR